MDQKKILIIDDEEAISGAIKLNLEDTGSFEVRTETDGRKVLEYVDEFNPDLIILDMVMPEIKGSEVEEILKGSETGKLIPVIFLTGTARDKDPNAMGVFIDGRYTIAKPFTSEQITEAVINYLRANPNLNRKKYMDW